MGDKLGDTDTLVLTGASNSGISVIDLNAADQIAQINGGVNGSIQTGIEILDLSGMTGTTGSTITGFSAAVNTITGTPNADVITGGTKVDTITASSGNDTINGGAGNDIYNMTDTQFDAISTANNGTIDLGDGTGDKVQIIGAGTIVDADFVDFVAGSVEILDFSTNVSVAVIGTNFEARGMTTIDSTGATLDLTMSGIKTATTGTSITGYQFNLAAEVLNFGGSAAAMNTTISGWTKSNGIYTDAGATVADFYAAIAGATNTAGEVGAFLDAGNMYVFAEGAATGAGDDSYITLVGVTATAVNATHNTGVIHIG